jgi:hypothetical protein
MWENPRPNGDARFSRLGCTRSVGGHQVGYEAFQSIERVAMVGDKKWQEWMAAFCKPFTTGKVRYFDHEKLDEARTWVTDN